MTDRERELMVTDQGERERYMELSLTLPRVNLKDRQLYDLELLMVGGFYPLKGFMNEGDYKSVVDTMRLADGQLFPIPIVLDVPETSDLSVGDSCTLCDQYGNPLAIMDIESRYLPDKTEEVRKVYGTDDITHPGVRYVLQQMGNVYLGGRVHGLTLPVRQDFKDIRHTPKELKKVFDKEGISNVVAFQTRNPMHRVHYELVKRAAERVGAPALVHPVVGMTREGDIDYITRVRTYRAVRDRYGKGFMFLSLLPLSMRMAGPREALWHAIIRRNYHCTHFIVGRDHAGPGKDSKGKSFYGPYEARDLALKHAEEIGIDIIPSDELGYSEKRDSYISSEELDPDEELSHISGTDFRRRLFNNEEIPEWFSFPESIEALRKGVVKQKNRGFTIFFTGLSGAGKSTVANILYSRLLEIQDKEVTLLDGDIIREHLSKGLGFSREDRETNISRVAYVASEITKHGGIAVCSLIAPYQRARQMSRELIEQHGSFIEVYTSASLEICEKRDTKGLYKRARQGLMTGFTGIDDPYEVPEHAEIVIDTEKLSPEESAEMIIDYLKAHGLLQGG